MNSKDTRITWIDELKGLAIFFVVLGHMPYEEDTVIIKSLIYSFHMPLFFLLAGCTAAISIKKTTSILFLRKRFISVFVPYIVWCAVYGLFFNKSLSGLTNYNIKEHFLCFIQGDVTNWFLACLFMLHVLYTIYNVAVSRINNNYGKILIALILFALIAALHKLYGNTSQDTNFPLYFLTSAYVYFIPFACGVMISQSAKVYNFILKNQIFISLCITISLITPGLIHTLNFGANYPKIITGICVSCLLIKLFTIKGTFPSFLSSVKNMLAVFGKYSLGIYLMSGLMIPATSLNLNGGIEAFIIYGAISIIICLLCIGLEKLMSQSKFFSLIFFGKPIKQSK